MSDAPPTPNYRMSEGFCLTIRDTPVAPLPSVHRLGAVGHVEDIAVAKDQQGKKLGLRIIQALDYISEKVGCYKSILDCSEANEGFYVKCGFRRAGLQMAHYYEGAKSKPQ